MDADDRRLFEDSLRKATETHSAAALDAALDDLGWRDALSDDKQVAVSTLFRMQGAANATSSAIDDVLLHALGLDVDVEASTAVLLPPIGRYDAPGLRGLGTQRLAGAEQVVVVSAADNGHVAAVVARGSLMLQPINGIDPSLGWTAVRMETTEPTQPVEWEAAATAGQVAIAHELVGASAAMLQLARDHAVQRVQFGRAIASFQAVRHRLADAMVAVESADAAVSTAWTDSSPLAAALAKAVAGRTARTVARHAQQVLGGMGFTTEHPLQRYIKRSIALDQLFGGSTRLTSEIGEQILHSQALPTMLPL
jgi:hypothetical protein